MQHAALEAKRGTFRTEELPKRHDLELITELIPARASVLDLGCGDGLLLENLRRRKQVERGRGIERDLDAVTACMRRGIPVVQADLDAGLADFPDKSFDVVVISHTLQQVHRPQKLLLEAGRVGERVIVGFPNFGHWQIRCGLLVRGRMPKSKMLPYEWYDTPNIHLLTITDFEDFCDRHGFRIQRRLTLGYPSWRPVTAWPGLLAAYALYLLDASAVRLPREEPPPPPAGQEIMVVEE